jgi:hypothetical protein
LTFNHVRCKVVIVIDIIVVEIDMKKRQLVYVPEVHPTSFVLLFEKGTTGLSWSVRDYSDSKRASVRYARELSLTLSAIREKAMRSGLMFDAPIVATTDGDYWHSCITGYNRRYLQKVLPALPQNSSEPGDSKVQTDLVSCYPVLAIERLRNHAKWLKRQDQEWILRNGRSEDWVTWNAFALLTSTSGPAWWPRLLFLAEESNSNLRVPAEWLETPEVQLWQTVASPRAYEAANRARMLCSGNRERILRSHSPVPVEGRSEIDVVLRNTHLLAFVEAKLGSDVSLRTTHDPSRNQIVRNIDCLLDQANGRTPFFLMLVRDAAEGRAYTQLISKYRHNPATLVEELPHHASEMVKSVARNLAIIRWKDLLAPSIENGPEDDGVTLAVKKELRIRVLSELE